VGRAHPALSRIQFQHHVDPDDGEHKLEAWLPGDDYMPSGQMRWSGSSGEIRTVDVDPVVQRRGIGTAMWKHAQQYDPQPVHSRVQSPAGKKWADKVGGSYADRYANVHE
jgi:hypothetical protein